MITKKSGFDPMDEEKYWQIIKESLKEGSYQSYQEHYLVHKLQKCSLEEIACYQLRTELLMGASFLSDLWCAASLMNNGCSNDGFDYFRCWLISRGKEVYQEALQKADSLVTQIDPSKQFYDFERFGYIAHSVFEQKTGENLYDYIREDMNHGGRSKIVFTWDAEEPETMRAICPRLFEKMGRG
jgi:hypothetical protein